MKELQLCFQKKYLIINIGKTKTMFCHSSKFGLLNKPQIVLITL
jgi:hypothetical protein